MNTINLKKSKLQSPRSERVQRICIGKDIVEKESFKPAVKQWKSNV